MRRREGDTTIQSFVTEQASVKPVSESLNSKFYEEGGLTASVLSRLSNEGCLEVVRESAGGKFNMVNTDYEIKLANLTHSRSRRYFLMASDFPIVCFRDPKSAKHLKYQGERRDSSPFRERV